MFQGRFRGFVESISRVFQESFESVEECLEVSSKLQRSFEALSKLFLERFQGSSRVFHESFKSVSKKFQGGVMEI